jgi:hypothetical protein
MAQARIPKGGVHTHVQSVGNGSVRKPKPVSLCPQNALFRPTSKLGYVVFMGFPSRIDFLVQNGGWKIIPKNRHTSS